MLYLFTFEMVSEYYNLKKKRYIAANNFSNLKKIYLT